ncbi:uncharacterized protein [Palaemon carinicauda]|uniref:uncharacterized protein n=1 Tax=Palaemon carinicauda TaxID=392227 RepID=UPI0035B5AB38
MSPSTIPKSPSSAMTTSFASLLGIILHQKTAYNTAASGIVECFHCTLKASLMSHCNDSNWFTQLPWILQVLRTTLKDTPDASPTEMVYGDPLVIPAESFLSTTFSDNLHHLCHVMGKFTPCHQTYKSPVKQHIPADLHSATDVFLRNDTNNPPLTPLYTGLFLVICKTPKA